MAAKDLGLPGVAELASSPRLADAPKPALTAAQLRAQALALIVRQEDRYAEVLAQYRADPWDHRLPRRYGEVVWPVVPTLEEAIARVAVQARQGFPASRQAVLDEMAVRASRVGKAA
jgi:hypothetical protein